MGVVVLVHPGYRFIEVQVCYWFDFRHPANGRKERGRERGMDNPWMQMSTTNDRRMSAEDENTPTR